MSALRRYEFCGREHKSLRRFCWSCGSRILHPGGSSLAAVFSESRSAIASGSRTRLVKNSSSTSIVEPEQAPQPFPTLKGSCASGVRTLFREEDHVALPLVGALAVVMCQELRKGAAKRRLSGGVENSWTSYAARLISTIGRCRLLAWNRRTKESRGGFFLLGLARGCAYVASTAHLALRAWRGGLGAGGKLLHISLYGKLSPPEVNGLASVKVHASRPTLATGREDGRGARLPAASPAPGRTTALTGAARTRKMLVGGLRDWRKAWIPS